MKMYPLKPLEIQQLRKSNYLNVKDVDNLRTWLMKQMEKEGREEELGSTNGRGDKGNIREEYGFDPMQVRLTFEQLQRHFSEYFSRPLRDTFLLNEVFKRLKKDEEGKVGLCECMIILAMISIGKPSERQSLAFSAMDTDGDGIISLSELTAFVEVITSIGWCYARQTYLRSYVFPPRFRRTDPKEMTSLLLKSVGVDVTSANCNQDGKKADSHVPTNNHHLSPFLVVSNEPSIPFAMFQRIPFNLV